MRVSSRFSALVLVSVLALACDDPPTAPGNSPIAFETVVKSSVSGFLAPQREVIRDPQTWARVWQQVHAGQNPVPALPGIDFGREMVVLAAMGTNSNGCYNVDVAAISMRASALEVEVSEFEPAANCGCLQVLTQPVHAVRLDRIDMAESFQVRRRLLRC